MSHVPLYLGTWWLVAVFAGVAIVCTFAGAALGDTQWRSAAKPFLRSALTFFILCVVGSIAAIAFAVLGLDS